MATEAPGRIDALRTAGFATLFAGADGGAEACDAGRREQPEVATARIAPKTNQAPSPLAGQGRRSQPDQPVARVRAIRVSNALSCTMDNPVPALSPNNVRNPGIPIPFFF